MLYPPHARGWKRYQRSFRVMVVVSLALAACLLAAAGTENAWYTGPLCLAHDNEEYRADLASRPELPQDCGACHTGSNWSAPGLRRAFPPLVDERKCLACHARDLKEDDEYGNAGRVIRPAHGGDGGWVKHPPSALRTVEAGTLRPPLRCEQCHPDHRGTRFTQMGTVRVEGKPVTKVVVRDTCGLCHLPAAGGAPGAAVRRNYLEAHKGVEEFKTLPGSPDAAAIERWLTANALTCVSCHGEHHTLTGDAFEKPQPK